MVCNLITESKFCTPGPRTIFFNWLYNKQYNTKNQNKSKTIYFVFKGQNNKIIKSWIKIILNKDISNINNKN